MPKPPRFEPRTNCGSRHRMCRSVKLYSALRGPEDLSTMHRSPENSTESSNVSPRCSFRSSSENSSRFFRDNSCEAPILKGTFSRRADQLAACYTRSEWSATSRQPKPLRISASTPSINICPKMSVRKRVWRPGSTEKPSSQLICFQFAKVVA